jgi:hypothetical protein
MQAWLKSWTMQRAIRRFRLAIGNVDILLPALLWLIVVRIGLTTASHRQLRRLFLTHTMGATTADHETQRVAWAIARMARLVPFASCLTQALAGQIMLARRHIGSTLHLGVAVAGAGEFAAHAWLEKDDVILLGGPRERTRRFVPLAAYGPIAE